MYASGRLLTMMNGHLYPPKTSHQDTLALYTDITALSNSKPGERAKECKSQPLQLTKNDRPTPLPTNSVPKSQQGRQTNASLPMHDADFHTIAAITNLSPTLPIPCNLLDLAQLWQKPFPLDNAQNSHKMFNTLPMTVQTTSHAAEQTLNSVHHNMKDTAALHTILDDKSIPSFPSNQLPGKSQWSCPPRAYEATGNMEFRKPKALAAGGRQRHAGTRW